MEHDDAARNADTNTNSDTSGPWWKKFAWLILIWSLSIATLGVVAYLLRVIMRFVGLTV